MIRACIVAGILPVAAPPPPYLQRRLITQRLLQCSPIVQCPDKGNQNVIHYLFAQGFRSLFCSLFRRRLSLQWRRLIRFSYKS